MAVSAFIGLLMKNILALVSLGTLTVFILLFAYVNSAFSLQRDRN